MNKMKEAVLLALMLIVIGCISVIALLDGGDMGISAKDISLGLDLDGGVSITYQAVEGSNPTVSEMDGVLAVIQHRLDTKGYTEATAYLDGTDRIRVEIPGVEDASVAVQEIGRTALLRFVGLDYASMLADEDFMEEYYDMYLDEVRANDMSDQGTTQANEDGSISLAIADLTDEEILSDAQVYFTRYASQAISHYPSILDKAMEAGYGSLVLTGANVSNATFQKGQMSQNSVGIQAYVKLEFDATGKELFAEGTQQYYNKYIAILLDDTVISMPTVSAVITDGTAVIQGVGDDDQAKSLADDIVGGALQVEMEDIEHNSVGATLGKNALDTSILAGIIGFVIIILFMIVFYRVPGVVASFALLFYVSAELMFISIFDWTLTLAGIAGFILSVGMAVDAN
ncbi:MAG: hypothetical protein HUJ69_03545, partial [Lachnospiraceae bacterium]|nr:hypothetical protein [Lachnospiraceae bacterium]